MMELLRDLGIISIGSFSIVGLIGFLAKHLFEKFLEAKIDTFKLNLAKEFEVFKAQVDKESYKFQTQFSSLHAERAQTTRELYKKLKGFYDKLYRVNIHANMQPPPEFQSELEVELIIELRNAYLDLSQTFEENRIMFSKIIIDKVSELTALYWEHEFIYQKVRIYEQMRELDKSEELRKKTKKRYEELYDIYHDTIPLILSAIENEFRELLGVEKG